MRILRIPDGDVACHAVGIPQTRKYPEGERHLLKHPLSLCGKARMLGDAREADALGDELQRRFLDLLGFAQLCGRGHDDFKDAVLAHSDVIFLGYTSRITRRCRL